MNVFKQIYYKYNFFANFALERAILLIFFATVSRFSVFQIGVLQALYSLSTAISEIPTGFIGDKIGRKKSLILGNILRLVGILLFLEKNNFILLGVAMTLQGIGGAFISGSEQALLFDNLKARKEEATFINISATASSVIFLAAFISTILGGFLQEISWDVIFILSAVAILCAIYYMCIIDDRENEVMDEAKLVFDSFETLKKTNHFKIIALFVVGMGFFEASYLCYFMMSQLFFVDLQVSTQEITIIYGLSRLLSMFIYYFLPKLRLKITDHWLLLISFISVPVILFLNVMNNELSSLMMYLSFFFLISFFGHLAPSIYSGRFNELLHSKYRSTFISMSSLVGTLILTFLYFIAGIMLDNNLTYIYFMMLTMFNLGGGFLIFQALKER